MREMIASRDSGSRVMGPIVFRERRRSHHLIIDEVERARLAGDVRCALLALHAHVTGRRNRRAAQLHKDVQQGKNKAPETVATLLADAFNDRAPLSDITALCDVIAGFFTAKRRGRIRSLRELSPLECEKEGALNLDQVAIDQGDHSAPTLKHFIADCEVNIALLIEMKQAATEELYGPQEART